MRPKHVFFLLFLLLLCFHFLARNVVWITIGTETLITESDFHTHSIHLKKEKDLLPNDGDIVNVYGRLNLVTGELPGYTGWPRPEKTLVSNFYIYESEIPRISGMVDAVKSGEKWSLIIQCDIYECREGGAHFYLRAYGPSVITGNTIDFKNGTYSMLFYLEDPGIYTVEVVLSFCCTNDWNSFPPENKYGGNNELLHEGYLVPGFPRQIHVFPEKGEVSEDNTIKPLCTAAQLVETSSTSALQKGRWVVTDMVRSGFHKSFSHKPDDVTLIGYELGLNSIGIRMDYKPLDCSLLSIGTIIQHNSSHIMDQCMTFLEDTDSPENKNSINLIFIGDSVMDLEFKFVRKLLKNSKAKNIKTHYIEFKDGILIRSQAIINELENMKSNRPNERRFIYFNSGLHDVDKLCCTTFEEVRRENNITSPSFSCLNAYKESMTKFIDYLGQYPAELKAFRSTTAGWMRYGNFGFGWNFKNQYFSKSPNFVAKINDVAFDVLQASGHPIYILDGYWSSLPRPDNTEISEDQQPGKHLVHPGLEVLSLLGRKWLHLLLRHLCSPVLD